MRETTRLLASVFSGFVLLTVPVRATPPTRIQAVSAPAAVTVYPDQAAVTRTASVAIPKGDSMVVLSNVPAGLVADSVNARGKSVGKVTIGSVETRQVTFDTTAVAERGKAIETRLRSVNERIAAIDVTLAALEAERELVDRLSAAASEGRPTGPNIPPGVGFRLADNPALWKVARTAVHDGVAEIGEAAHMARAAKEDLAREKATVEAEMRSVAGAQGTGLLEFVVAVSAETETTLELSVTYQVSGASWHPVYEARLDSATGKLALRNEAAVVQRTGEDWEAVAVTLSTARPAAGVQAAALQPWRVALLDPALSQKYSQPVMSPAALLAVTRSVQQIDPALRGSLGSATDAPPLPPAPIEVERASAAMVATGLSVEYLIPGLASIPTDGTERRVRIDDSGADAVITARSVPRIDPRGHASLAAPGFGAVTRLGIAADHRRLGLGAANSHIVGVCFDQAVEHLVVRQTEDVIHAIGLAPRHHLGPAVMTVASNGQPRLRPMLPDPAHQAAQMIADLSTGRRRAGRCG